MNSRSTRRYSWTTRFLKPSTCFHGMSGAKLRLSWLIRFVDSARVCRFRITASRTRVLFKNDSRSPARYSSMRRMHSRMCPNTAGLTSERNRLFENLIADKRMECALRGNVHPSSQLLFQIGQESSWKKGSPVWSRLYQQVQIAVVTGVAPRKRANTRMLLTPCLAAIARIASRFRSRSSWSVITCSIHNVSSLSVRPRPWGLRE